MITFEHGLKLYLPDLLATQALASAIAKVLRPGLCIYLHGDLGAGKTTLVRAMLQALGHTGAIKSPTYTVVESYFIDSLELYHFDLYRVSDPAELDFIGIRDYSTATAICIFEWATNGVGNIPHPDIEIFLEFQFPGRQIRLMANTNKGLEVLRAMTIGTE